MNVTKRNGDVVPYSADKIRAALTKALKASGEWMDGLERTVICIEEDDLDLYDGIGVEEIQDQLEEALMERSFFKTAKAFILYRKEHAEDRELQGRLDYMNRYVDAENAATGSETDPNANVSIKNVANLESEVWKEKNRKVQRQRMKKKLKEMYPEVAEQYAQDIENHICYVCDESVSPAIKPYCQAVTLYPLMLEGTGNIDGVTPSAPNDLQSFSGQITNLVFLLSSQVKGACLYKDAPLLVNENGSSFVYTAKDLVEKYLTSPSTYSNYQGVWEYTDITDKNLLVSEDGKYTKITKVMRRRYDDLIYRITSNDGRVVNTSKDHRFKQLIYSRLFETRADNLEIGDTVCLNKDNSMYIDYDSKEWKQGWIIGMLCGDGCITHEGLLSLAVNYEQEYFGDIFNQYSSEIYGYTLAKNKGHKCFNFERTSKDWYQKITAEIIGKCTYDKHINLANKSLEYILGFLDGLMSSDGCIDKKHCTKISSCSKDLIQNVVDICSKIGVHTSIYPYQDKRKNRSVIYTVNISNLICKYLRHSLTKQIESKKYQGFSFHKDVLCMEPYHYGYNALVRANHHYPNRINHWGSTKNTTTHKTEVITNIETFFNDDDYVYEIETESHWYNVNGFITHNCAVGDIFVALNYYVIKEFGEKWYDHLDDVVTTAACNNQHTVRDMIRKAMKQFIYGVNQPAGNRSYNSPFTNVSYYDSVYFNSLFEHFCYPDGTKPEWKAIDTLQRMFMELHRELRLIKPLTFPVSTIAMVHDGKDIIDKEYKELCAEEWAKGGSFFAYINDSPTSLSSCCRVLNEVTDNTFSSTIGLTGIMTGSCNVITLNFNRIIQQWYKECTLISSITMPEQPHDGWFDGANVRRDFQRYLTNILERVYKYQIAYKTMLYDSEEKGMFSNCNAGYIRMNKLYCTIGLLGYCEAAEFLGYEVSNNDRYKDFLSFVFGTVKEQNRIHSIRDAKRPFVFNTEAVPGENMAVKFYQWDKSDGYKVPEDQNLYSSYFFKQWDDRISVLDKLKLHGKYINSSTDGGQACHIHLQEHLSKEQYLKIIDLCVAEGVNYFTFNIPVSECKNCGHVVNAPVTECPICGSHDIDYWIRIIGFLRPVSTWSKERQIEAGNRIFSKANEL